MTFRVLGPVEVVGPKGYLLGEGGRGRALIGLLALNPGRLVALNRLIDALWGDDPPRTAEHSVQSHIARVRRALEACGLPGVLLTHPPGYRLRADPSEVDAAVFERHVAEAPLRARPARPGRLPGAAGAHGRRAGCGSRPAASGDLHRDPAPRRLTSTPGPGGPHRTFAPSAAWRGPLHRARHPACHAGFLVEQGDEPVAALVCGPAGVGKTALVSQWAQGSAKHFPAGQLFVDLRGDDPHAAVAAADALGQLLRGLGVPSDRMPGGEAERSALFRSPMQDRRALLVPDNAARTNQVLPLMPGSPSNVVIVRADIACPPWLPTIASSPSSSTTSSPPSQ